MPVRRRPRRWSITTVVGMAAAFDFLAVIGAASLVALLGLIDDDTSVPVLGYGVAAVFCALMIVLMLDYMRFYSVDRLFAAQRTVGPILAACAAAACALLLTSWAATGRVGYDGDWLATFSVLCVAILISGHQICGRVLARGAAQGRFTRNVIVIGAGDVGLALVRQIRSAGKPWNRVLGLFDDRARDSGERVPRRIDGVRVLGTVGQALKFARRTRVDDIVVALPLSANERIREILHTAEALSADVHIATGTLLPFGVHRSHQTDALPTLHVSPKPVAGWRYVVKRTMDLLISGSALIVISPLLMLIALAIKLESQGPILFKQARYGINGRTINVFKFRSMYHHMRDANATRLVTRDDPRVSPLGRILRRTSLDELPQLFNVLRGEMSIVGPRPHAKNARAAGRTYQEVVEAYAHRHRIKPGITGWAQVSGWRGETDTEEKIIRRCEHDLYYINHWSVGFDLWIMLATLRAPFQKAAY